MHTFQLSKPKVLAKFECSKGCLDLRWMAVFLTYDLMLLPVCPSFVCLKQQRKRTRGPWSERIFKSWERAKVKGESHMYCAQLKVDNWRRWKENKDGGAEENRGMETDVCLLCSWGLNSGEITSLQDLSKVLQPCWFFTGNAYTHTYTHPPLNCGQ